MFNYHQKNSPFRLPAYHFSTPESLQHHFPRFDFIRNSLCTQLWILTKLQVLYIVLIFRFLFPQNLASLSLVVNIFYIIQLNFLPLVLQYIWPACNPISTYRITYSFITCVSPLVATLSRAHQVSGSRTLTYQKYWIKILERDAIVLFSLFWKPNKHFITYYIFTRKVMGYCASNTYLTAT